MLSEARRALFNRESVVKIFVNSLILNDTSSTVAVAAAAATGVQDGKVARGAIGARVSAGGSATLVGVVRGRNRERVRGGGVTCFPSL